MMLMAKKQIKEDGVWLNMQDGHHKKMKKQEMKVFTMYEGWDAWKEKQLSAAKAPKKDGKGSPYVEAIRAHIPLLEAMQTASRKAFTGAFC